MNTMLNVQIGTFPGQINNYALEEGTTVRAALETAGLTVGDEQEVKLDGVAVSLDAVLPSTAKLLLVTKRLKGAR